MLYTNVKKSMSLNKCQAFCFFSVVLIFTGCTNISQPIASTPLVNHEISKEKNTLSKNIIQQLELNTTSIRIDKGEKYSLSGVYLSAAGTKCRRATLRERQLVFCKTAETWEKVDSIFLNEDRIREARPQ